MSATRNIIFNEFKKLLRGPSFIITLVFFSAYTINRSISRHNSKQKSAAKSS